MLCSTFIHLPGIGITKEKYLWEKGIFSWDVFCDEKACSPVPFAKRQYLYLRSLLDECRERVQVCDPAFFRRSLESRHLWRLFSRFRETTAYLDIETTGLGGPSDHITTIALYDGKKVSTFVHGENLDDFPQELEKYKVLVTYNGTSFDLPFIRSSFGITVDQVHIDLRYLLASLGYRGGLKGCEKKLGLDRAELDGVDGYFAVLLWQEYRKTGNPKALETLLAYNIADTVNLEHLMVLAYNLKLDQTPFCDRKIPLPDPPGPEFNADVNLVCDIRDRCCYSF